MEPEILPLCRKRGIGFVAYSPLGRGFLTATITQPKDLMEKDRRHDHPRFQLENMAHNVPLLDPLQKISKECGFTPAQVALAWLLSRGDDIVPIHGTKRRGYLEENLKALDCSLTETQLKLLEAIFSPGIASGTRYPQKQLAGLGI